MRLSSLQRVARFVALAFLAALFSVVIVVAPGCGRSSLELETPTEGGISPGACTPSNCPSGCCDGNTCRTGADTRACGSRGGRCNDCVATGFQFCDNRTKACARNVTNCSSSTCPGGCCSFETGTPACLAGTDPAACGRSGASCTDCAALGRSCDTAKRSCGTSQCDASNCSGCCVGDKCLSGRDNQACGSRGEACDSCSAMAQTCQTAPGGGGQCTGTPTCSAANCGGCCDGTTCRQGFDQATCGRQGNKCSNCAAQGQQCVQAGPGERTCQPIVACTPQNCAGCCSGTNCVFATTPAACGKGAQACKACQPNESCTAGVCTPLAGCNAGTCPGGCCIGDACVTPGNQPAACGTGGAACANCQAVGQVCQGAACRPPPCGPLNCGGGCCNAAGACVGGTDVTACGVGGVACNNCQNAGQVCQARQCRDVCSPANCAGGCCLGNVCVNPGNQPAACGVGGGACANCQAMGQVCQGGVCGGLCGAATCPGGCCIGDVCVSPGNQPSACGIGGAACADCQDMGLACVAAVCQ